MEKKKLRISKKFVFLKQICVCWKKNEGSEDNVSDTDDPVKLNEKQPSTSVVSNKKSSSCMTDPDDFFKETDVSSGDNLLKTEKPLLLTATMRNDHVNDKLNTEHFEQSTKRSLFTQCDVSNPEKKHQTDQLVKAILNKYLTIKKQDTSNPRPPVHKPTILDLIEPRSALKRNQSFGEPDGLKVEYFSESENEEKSAEESTRVREKVEDKIEKRVEVEVEKRVDEKIEKKVVKKVEPKIEKKVENKIEEKVKNKIEERVENKTEQRVENKIQKKIEEKSEDVCLMCLSASSSTTALPESTDDELPKPRIGDFPAKTKSAPTNSTAHDSLADICTKFSRFKNQTPDTSRENTSCKKKLELVFNKSSEEMLSNCEDGSAISLQYTISCEDTPTCRGISTQDSVLRKYETSYDCLTGFRSRTITSRELRIQPSARGELNGYSDSATSLRWKLIVSHHKDLKPQ